ncbi:disulfide bond formation protein B [Parasphingorhabdus sp.]|uniref:disulfide bond formation protein B n=1 Tax=Parasphingorhabdus sp. TaxID=2709688 RepID=UPI00326690AA
MASTRMAGRLALIIPSGLLGGALVSEYVFGLYPCEMCMWQRWPHLAAIVFAIIALISRKQNLSKLMLWGAATAICASGLIGGFHAGVEYGWWEGITTCATSGEVSLDSIMDAPLVRCDVAPWSLFGISLAGYNFLLSLGGAIAILMLLAKGRKDV